MGSALPSIRFASQTRAARSCDCRVERRSGASKGPCHGGEQCRVQARRRGHARRCRPDRRPCIDMPEIGRHHPCAESPLLTSYVVTKARPHRRPQAQHAVAAVAWRFRSGVPIDPFRLTHKLPRPYSTSAVADRAAVADVAPTTLFSTGTRVEVRTIASIRSKPTSIRSACSTRLPPSRRCEPRELPWTHSGDQHWLIQVVGRRRKAVTRTRRRRVRVGDRSGRDQPELAPLNCCSSSASSVSTTRQCAGSRP